MNDSTRLLLTLVLERGVVNHKDIDVVRNLLFVSKQSCALVQERLQTLKTRLTHDDDMWFDGETFVYNPHTPPQKPHLRIRQSFLNHKRVGKYEEWHDTVVGFIKTVEGFYQDGKLEGERKTWWICTGKLKKHSHYRNGILHGKCEEWYQNGVKSGRCYYQNGVIIGMYESWYESGEPFARHMHNDFGPAAN